MNNNNNNAKLYTFSQHNKNQGIDLDSLYNNNSLSEINPYGFVANPLNLSESEISHIRRNYCLLANSSIIYATFASGREIKGGKEFIASIYTLKNTTTHTLSVYDYSKALSNIFIRKIVIYNIYDASDHEIDLNLYPFIATTPTNLCVYHISLEFFIDNILMNDNFNEDNADSFYMFHFDLWSTVINKCYFNEKVCIISGGSNTKRHALTPNNMRLSYYMLSLFLNNAELSIKSNAFNLPTNDYKIKVMVDKSNPKLCRIPLKDGTVKGLAND